MNKFKKTICYFAGFISGILNGMLGAGGGMIIVPVLNKCNLEAKKSHATCVAIIFSICFVSAFIYVINGTVEIKTAAPFLIWGLIGSIIGSKILTKIKDNFLSKVFALIILWASYKMLVS